MPTYTAIALDRLIEPGPAKSMATVKSGPNSKLERQHSAPVPNPKAEKRKDASATATLDKKHHWARMSPALYATPKSTPLPDSPSSFPPSPYIVNHKRRGPRLLKSLSEPDVATHEPPLDTKKVAEISKDKEKEVSDSTAGVTVTVAPPSQIEEEHVNAICDGELGSIDLANGLAEEICSTKSVTFNLEREGEASEDFFDPQDSMSVKSSSEVESNSGVERSLNPNTPISEFFDAWEELSSENGRQPSLQDIEAELREMRLSLLMEIEKRKQAEEAVDNMQSQWLKIRQQLSIVGLTLPAYPVAAAEDENPELDPEEEICRQVHLVRFVSNSIGRGIAKAEAEVEMEAQIESKNFEIARLWDRLHYYEAVNREMSQRNQEAIEMARRLRQRRKRRQRWVWGSIAAAITLGTAGLAWSYLPTGKGLASTSQSVASEPDHTAK